MYNMQYRFVTMDEQYIRSRFQELINGHYPIRSTLRDMLSASDWSSFACAFSIDISRLEERKYLSPLRDMPEYDLWFKQRQNNGDRIVLIGKDLQLLMVRIMDPEMYWKMVRRHKVLNVWIAAIPSVALRKWNNIIYRSRSTYEFSDSRKDEEELRVAYKEVISDYPHVQLRYDEPSFINRMTKWSSSKAAFIPLPCKDTETGFICQGHKMYGKILSEGFTQSTVESTNRLRIYEFHGTRNMDDLACEPAAIANIDRSDNELQFDDLMTFPNRLSRSPEISMYIDISKDPHEVLPVFATHPYMRGKHTIPYMDKAIYIKGVPSSFNRGFIAEISLE